MDQLSLKAEACSNKPPSLTESWEVPAATVLSEPSRTLRSAGADKHFIISDTVKHKYKASVKRGEKLQELRASAKSSSEDDDELLDSDVFLDTERVLQGARESTYAGVAERHPSASAQPLLEPQKFEGLQTLPVAQSATPAIVGVSTSVASTVAAQQQQPLPQPPVVQPANVQAQQLPVIGQVPQQNNLNPLAVSQEVEDIAEMAEDKQVAPSQFKGKTGENAEDWLRHFENYCAYRGLDEPKKLALFKVLMTELAGDWLATLTDDILAQYDRVKAAFESRYALSEMMKYRSAKEVFSRKQLEGEPVDEYLTKVQKAARIIGADEKTTVYAALNNLKSTLIPYVTQQRPQDIKTLLEAARMAELTIPSAAQTDIVVSAQLAEVRDEIKEMNKKWQQLTVQPLKLADEEEPPQKINTSPRVVGGGGRGQFGYFGQQQRGGRFRPPIQWQSQSRSQVTSNQLWTPRAAAPQWNLQSRQWPRQTWYNNNGTVRQSMCRNCGRQSHDHPRQCPAVNQYCRLCGRMGHYGRCCMTAAKAMQMQSQAQNLSGNYSQ